MVNTYDPRARDKEIVNPWGPLRSWHRLLGKLQASERPWLNKARCTTTEDSQGWSSASPFIHTGIHTLTSACGPEHTRTLLLHANSTC